MASPEHLPVQAIPIEKSRLQEYTQRACVQLPIYHTLNEVHPNALKFRSQVLVDGIWYTSPNAFASRKEAEHDAAKHAFIGLREKLKAEGRSLILEDLHFCKIVLNEYAVKMNIAMPTYVTNESKAHVPIFESSLQLNGVTFSGDAARTKKEAEQLAARSAILSILASEAGTTMSEILKSKFRLHNALKLAKDSSSIQASPVMDSSSIPKCVVNKFSSNTPACITKDTSVTLASSAKDPSVPSTCIVKASSSIPACIAKHPASMQACIVKHPASSQVCIVKDTPNIHLGPAATEVAPLDSALVSVTSTKEVDVGISAIKDTLAAIRHPSFAPFPSLQLAHSESASEQPSRSQSTHQTLHVLKNPKPISSAEAVTPIAFVPTTIEQASESPPLCSTSGKKRRRNKKARKNLLHQSPSTTVMVPQNQVLASRVTN